MRWTPVPDRRGGCAAAHRYILVWMLPIVVAVSLASCTNGLVQYGVVLWSADTPLPDTGTIVEASEPDPVTGEVTVAPVGGRETVTVPRGYVRLVPEYEAATRFARAYRAYLDAFAISREQAVHVRADADLGSEIIYRLRRDERVKLIRIDPERLTINGSEGQWVEILTRSGQRGYTFSPLLRLPRDLGEIASFEGDVVRRDAVVDKLFEHTWRPSYMSQMVESGTIRLSALDPEIGLFPNENDQTITIRTRTATTEFSTMDYEAVDDRTYLFDDGALRVDAFDDDRITVTYTQNGTIVSEVYVVLRDPVVQIIESERERRQKVYERLASGGPVYVSATYGVLHFALDRHEIRWSDRTAMEPGLIPPGTSATAKVRFNVFLDDELRDQYSGALSLVFDGSGRPVELVFAYELSDTGLRMTYVPLAAAQDDLIQDVDPSGLVMFFRAAQEREVSPPSGGA